MATLDVSQLINYKKVRKIARNHGFKINNIKATNQGWYEAITSDNRTELLIHADSSNLWEYDDVGRCFKEVER